MSKSNVDVYVYVMSGDKLDRVPGLASKIGQLAGVVKAKANERVKQLVSIKYDPSRTSSGALLNAVRSNGYKATLVGM